MADNNLKSFPTAALRLLPDLAELYLSGNAIKTIPANAFSPFRSLTILHMNSCRLSTIERFGLRGLGTLKKLQLADNNLSTVPVESLSHVTNLEEIDLGRNPFTQIRKTEFSALKKLIALDLSGCGQLSSIDADAFRGCVDLERVTISLNMRLSRLAGNAFDALPGLKFLNLADNALQTFEAEDLNVSWDKLEALDLSGNPWRCDCDLAFLVQTLKEGVANGLGGGAKCASPVHLRTQPLASVSPGEFSCSTRSEGEAIRHEPIEGGASAEDEGVDRIRRTNATAVIISVSIVIVTLVLALCLFIVFRFKGRMEDWAKEWRWRRHDRAIARKGGALAPGNHYGNPHAQGPLEPYRGSHEYHAPVYACDDEHYYYVATMQNRVAAGKHIPVTEL